MKHKSISKDTTIRDLLDVIHWTIIKEEDNNERCQHELNAIDNKIQTGYLENYKVVDTTFWQALSGYKAGDSFWLFRTKELFIYGSIAAAVGFVLGLII